MTVGRSIIDHLLFGEWSRIVFETTPTKAGGGLGGTVGQSGLPLSVVVGLLGVLVVFGVGVTVVRTGVLDSVFGSTDTPVAESTEPATTAGDPVDATTPDESAAETTADTLSAQTLDRFESVVPAAASRARSQSAIEWSNSDLRHEIEDAIADGRLDPAVSSPFDASYEIVNLPQQYRELTLPVSGESVHISELEAVARESVANDPPRDVARTVSAIHDHCQRIESHIQTQETAFIDAYRPVEETVQDIRELTDRFEGAFGNRLSEFVIDGRHEQLPGIVDIEQQLADGRRFLHRTAFDDAMRTLDTAVQTADDLLMTVDFLGGVVGTIDHGGGRVPIPESVPRAVLSDLLELAEQQYDATLEITDQALVVTETPTTDSSSESTTESFEPETDFEPSPHEQVTPEAVADEVLFLFRELTTTSHNVAECQTEQLPDSVARPEILSQIVSFCRRQPDVVDAVDLQEGAPPGFLEIEFTDRVDGDDGLETLRDRYATQHGGA